MSTNMRGLPRVRFQHLERAGVVRELEMEVDQAITSPGYTIRFWQDVRIYGIEEAILYVKNGKHGDHEAITKAWHRVRPFVTV